MRRRIPCGYDSRVFMVKNLRLELPLLNRDFKPWCHRRCDVQRGYIMYAKFFKFQRFKWCGSSESEAHLSSSSLEHGLYTAGHRKCNTLKETCK
ncbi:hypothetical protein TNCV_3394521 [Trichonephila clavipes]|nr:hypothetical protein TNCV_3394521 [Trichonephila clavipes]